MRRQLNLKFTAALLVSLVLIGVGGHFLHAYQFERNASAIKRRAEEAQDKKEFAKALGYFIRYLRFRPDDTDALSKYGLLLEREVKAGNSRLRAFLILEE